MFDYRKYGRPRTEEERRERHSGLYPGESLPKRGTGLVKRYGHIPAGRRLGRPRTDVERARMHLTRFGTSELPPRGSGLRNAQGSTWLESLHRAVFGG